MCLLSLLLTGCDNPVTSGSDNPIVKEELAPTLVDDSRLTQYGVLEETFNNKIVLENTGAADPFVMRYNGMYYLYMTTGGSAIRGHKSYDLYNWQMVNNRVNGEGFVYKYAQDDNLVDSKSTAPYAPEVFYFDGSFYLITSPSGNGYYFVDGTPEFVEEGYVVKNFSVNGLIDKNTYFNKTYSMSLSVSNIGFGGYVGLVFNDNAYSLYTSADADGANYDYPYSGYLLSIDSNYITLSDVRFNDIVEIESYSYKYEANKLMTLSVKQDNNTYTVYLDNN